MAEIGRFAPSTTGDPHPGTLLSALLVWLDARAQGGKAFMRLEDLDRERCTEESASAIEAATQWLGLDWDVVVRQRDRGGDHEAALDHLAASGRLYPCFCSRAAKVGGRRAPDGSWAYDNVCRERQLLGGDWRTASEPLRVRLDDELIEVADESGVDLSQRPASIMGDPVVRRRDGSVAYQLAVVVDDAAQGVTRVVRGRDIAPSTATQVALANLLGLRVPRYRHHLLLLEPDRTQKLAKLHRSTGWSELRRHLSGDAMCGMLAHAIGLTSTPLPVTPAQLLEHFSWAMVRDEDVVLAPPTT